ncbi:MAG: ADOP family duplicated permease [Blastocatellia bacterium]
MTRNSDPPNTSRTAHNFPVIGRLRAGLTLAQARAELSAIAQQLRQTHGEKMNAVDFAAIPLQSYLTRNVREGLWLLLGAAALLPLVACANFFNLLLAQFTARQREFTVRTALGAERFRLARQLIVENMLLTLPTALCGAMLASFGVDMLLLLDQNALPHLNIIAVDKRVLLFACGLAVIIAVVSGLLPALRPGQWNLQTGLKDAGRGASADAASRRWRSALVVAQISLTLVLLAGAGLLIRSFLKVLQVNPGFSAESAVTMTLSLPSTITPEQDEQIRRFYVQLLERAAQLPGVTAVGGANSLPLDRRGSSGPFLINDDPGQRGEADYRVASGGYFAAMKIPLLRGRVFNHEDTVNSPHAAVISQSLAQRYWPDQDPIGQRIQFGNMDTDKRLLHIVGVVGDVRDTLEARPEPMVYACSLQRPQWWQVSRLSIIVRAQNDPAALTPALRATGNQLRADVPLSFRTLEQVFSSSLSQRRFSLVLFAIFGVIALLIAAIGLYGVMSFAVAERRQEIGIRMALGAQARDVLRLVIGQGVKLVLAGIALGAAGSYFATRWVRAMLYEVSATDPLTFAAISLLLLVVALVACWIPARRATKVDPMIALRSE